MISPSCCRECAAWVSAVSHGAEGSEGEHTFLPSLAVWRRIRLRTIVAILLTLLALASYRPAVAQESRKLKSSVQPLYPELARRGNVYGIARLEVLIARDGTIKD